MRMMVRRPVLLTNITAIIAGFAMFSVFVLVPNFVETPTGLPPELAQLVDYGFGASATKAGLYLLPSAIVLLFAGPIGGLLGRRVGFKWPLAIGMALVSVAAAMLALWNDEPWQVVASQPIFGVGIGFAFAAMATIIAQSVRPSETGVASGMAPPTLCIATLVFFQAGLAVLLRPWVVRRLDAGGRWTSFNEVINRFAMPLYLLHSTGLAIARGLWHWLRGGQERRQPDLVWWLFRPLAFLGALICTLPVIWLFGRRWVKADAPGSAGPTVRPTASRG